MKKGALDQKVQVKEDLMGRHCNMVILVNMVRIAYLLRWEIYWVGGSSDISTI